MGRGHVSSPFFFILFRADLTTVTQQLCRTRAVQNVFVASQIEERRPLNWGDVSPFIPETRYVLVVLESF